MRLWVAHWGNAEQKLRFATGMLSRPEFEQLVLPRVYAPLADYALFVPLRREALAELQQASATAEDPAADVSRCRFHETAYQVYDAMPEQTEAARPLIDRMERALPGQVTSMLIGHEAAFTDAGVRVGPAVVRYGLGVTIKIGGWTLHREFALPR